MSETYTEAQLREFAKRVVTSHAEDIDYGSIAEMAEHYLGGDLSDEQLRRVADLVSAATITVEIPTTLEDE